MILNLGHDDFSTTGEQRVCLFSLRASSKLRQPLRTIWDERGTRRFFHKGTLDSMVIEKSKKEDLIRKSTTVYQTKPIYRCPMFIKSERVLNKKKSSLLGRLRRYSRVDIPRPKTEWQQVNDQVHFSNIKASRSYRPWNYIGLLLAQWPWNG